MEKNPTYFDTKTIILNLLNEDKKTYLSIERLNKLLSFIYHELKEKCKLGEYDILFDINFEAIERTVIYNNNIFSLDIEGDKIYLKDDQDLNSLTQQYKVDQTVFEIIKKFKNDAA